ncbi:General alpha-glucoside permease [Colletotrichum sp. SAR 10_96]|nr:General alpha-glucoside permease [Colletotrichum sp. SAR 10_96]
MSTTTEKPTSGFAELFKNKRVLSWCLLIFILPINFGHELALVGNILAIPSFLNKFGVTTATGAKEISTHDQQILNASTTIGVFVAACTTGFISDIIGRRLVVLLGCGLCIAGIMVQGFSNSIMMLFGGKLISTVGYGLGHTLGPVYVAEIAPDSLRGVCLILINTMIVLGQWSCALVGYGGSFIESDWGWRLPVFTQLVPPVLVLVLGGLLLPESPTWLLMKGRREEAAKALRKFNGPKHNVEETLAIMETTLEKERELNDRGASYLDYFFTIAGVGNPIGIAQVCYSIQLLGNICSWFLVKRTGRRPLIVWGIISMSALLLLIGGLSVIENNQQALAAVVALMALWGFLYQLSIGAVAFAVGGETPSPRLRQKTYSITIMSNTSAGCLVTQLIPFLINPSNANLGGKKGVPARKFKDYKCEVETVEGKDGEKVAVVLKD